MGYIVNWEELIKDKDVPIFKCASIKLKRFLLLNDVLYIGDYQSSETGKTIWLFIKTQKVQRLLEQWSENNPNKKRTEKTEVSENG